MSKTQNKESALQKLTTDLHDRVDLMFALFEVNKDKPILEKQEQIQGSVYQILRIVEKTLEFLVKDQELDFATKQSLTKKAAFRLISRIIDRKHEYDEYQRSNW